MVNFGTPSKGTRGQSKLQEWASVHNWSSDVMIRGMIGGLRWLARKWPSIDIQRAVWALESIDAQIELEWSMRRQAMREELALSKEIEEKVNSQKGSERNGPANYETRNDCRR